MQRVSQQDCISGIFKVVRLAYQKETKVSVSKSQREGKKKKIPGFLL
jgi:hypothetical protein